MKLDLKQALADIRPEIPPPAYEILVHIMRWADLWDRVHSGKPIEVDSDVVAALLTPFSGFGPPALWETVRVGLGSVVMARIMDVWASPDPKPSMVEALLLDAATTTAMLTAGPDAHRKVHKIIFAALRK